METLIYILLGIAFFIFKVIQESSKQKQESNKNRPVNKSEPFIPYEENEGRKEPSHQATRNQPTRTFSESRDRREETATSWEELRQVLLEEEKKKEMAKVPTKTVTQKPKAKAAEPIKREQSIESSRKNVLEGNSYSEILSDSESLKKAFVLAEILKKREV